MLNQNTLHKFNKVKEGTRPNTNYASEGSTVVRLLSDEEKATAEANGICKKTLYHRVYVSDKWSIEEAIAEPPGTVRHVYDVPNRVWIDKAKENGISRRLFHDRLKAGWCPHKASTKPVRKYNKGDK